MGSSKVYSISFLHVLLASIHALISVQAAPKPAAKQAAKAKGAPPKEEKEGTMGSCAAAPP